MAKILPFDPKRRRRWTRASDYGAKDRSWLPILAAALAAFTAVFLWPGEWPSGEAVELRTGDAESASFSRCGSGARVNCVVDGDTFWYRGDKYRVADINTPEVSEPACDREAELGARATRRLEALLNAGRFTLEPVDRDRDAYDRLLRTVTRDGESLGAVLVREGLAEEWRGVRASWC